MSHLLREHKRPILWGIIILVGVSFGVLGAFDHIFRGGNKAGPSEAESDNMIVATVGQATVQAYELRRQMSAARDQRAKQTGQDVTNNDLMADGTADYILQNLINGAVLRDDTQANKFNVHEEYLEQKLQGWDRFKDSSGTFNPNSYNHFIDQVKNNPQLTWKEIFHDVASNINSDVYLAQAMAAGRVLDAEVRREFETGYTTLKIKYFEVAPEEKPTEEQIKAEYENNITRYDKPPQRSADFVAISLRPEKPALLNDIVKRAQAGEDFPALVTEFSDDHEDLKAKGGDVGWKQNVDYIPAYMKPIFDHEPGDVTDAIEGALGYYIYKIEEERVNKDTQKRELKVRQLKIDLVHLSEEEKADRKAKAEALATAAKNSGGLAAAAKEAGLEVLTSGLFSTEFGEIENIDTRDTYTFRNALKEADKDEISGVIECANNLYVASVKSIGESRTSLLEDVRSRVERDTVNTIKASPEFAQKMAKYATDIAEKAGSIEEAKTLFPELNIVAKDFNEFNLKEFKPYSAPPYWQIQHVYQAVGFGEAGAFGGPVADFMQKIYFVELVSKTPPDEAAEAKWDEEQKTIRENMLASRKNLYLSDHIKVLREQKEKLGEVFGDQAIMREVLGISTDTTDGEQPGENTDAATENQS